MVRLAGFVALAMSVVLVLVCCIAAVYSAISYPRRDWVGYVDSIVLCGLISVFGIAMGIAAVLGGVFCMIGGSPAVGALGRLLEEVG